MTDWLITEVLFKSAVVQKQQLDFHNFSVERVERRLARPPSRPDLWTTILAKSEGPDGLSLLEHHSNAGVFMIAGISIRRFLRSFSKEVAIDKCGSV